ncbi:hypothetical protein Barb7_02017 [Bacteroidales bacterium Barb7]|nr:hypothetical protein Barb7_02017 [Bacteroidales bacterium Barb7]
MKDTFGFPVFPFLVEMITTPLAEREPYTAVALASFKMSIYSMSFTLMSEMEPL